MKVVILAGGRSQRFQGSAEAAPKALAHIGTQPILWHVMQHYASFGHRDFVIALGHHARAIKQFLDGTAATGENFQPGSGWRIESVDTGLETNTGGRVKRLASRLANEPFLLTWCDGLANVDIDALLAFHRSHGKLATVTAVHPPSQFGTLDLHGSQVVRFREKERLADSWVNGAFFALEPQVLDYIAGDRSSFEHDVLDTLAKEGELMAFRHEGFWRCMDTPKDHGELQEIWDAGQAPWARARTNIPPSKAVEPQRKRVLVTGHDGYIGRVLVPMLLQEGYDVVGLDNHLFDGCDFPNDSSACRILPCIQAFDQDVRDVNAPQLEGFAAVIHLAAISNDPLGNLNADTTMEINHAATVKLARLAKAAGVERFLHSSTCSIYGVAGNDWVDESSEFNPLTPYGVAKMQAEYDLKELADDSFSPVYLRNATAYGVSPRLRGDLVVNNLVGYAYTTGEVLLKSTGVSWRPLVHVEDICRAFLAALSAPRAAVHNRAFNVGQTRENYLVRDIAVAVSEIVPHSTVRFADGANADQRSYRVNCDTILNELPGFEPQWDLRRGIEELYDAYTCHRLTVEELESPRLQRIKHVRAAVDRGRIDERLRISSFTTPLARAA